MFEAVQKFKPKRVYLGRVAHGADIHQSLEAFCAEKEIDTAWFSAIGALSQATISYYDQEKHEYFTQTLQGDYEIVSCTGNVSLKDGKPSAHIHLVLSDTRYGCLAGHLMPGSVRVFACEFALQTFEGDSSLIRVPDAVTGLALWPATCPLSDD